MLNFWYLSAQFFNPFPTATADTDTRMECRGLFQFVATFGNRIASESSNLSHALIAAASESLGFQTNEQTTLMLVQGTQKEIQLVMQ